MLAVLSTFLGNKYPYNDGKKWEKFLSNSGFGSMCVCSILHHHLQCTHYILWTPTFLCDNSMSPLAWCLPQSPSLILWQSYMCLLAQAHCQTATSADSVSLRALIFTPACGPCTQQHFSIRKTGKVKLGVNVMTFVSNLSLSHCAHRRFNSVPYFFPFICFSSFASFCCFPLCWFSVFSFKEEDEHGRKVGK